MVCGSYSKGVTYWFYSSVKSFKCLRNRPTNYLNNIVNLDRYIVNIFQFIKQAYKFRDHKCLFIVRLRKYAMTTPYVSTIVHTTIFFESCDFGENWHNIKWTLDSLFRIKYIKPIALVIYILVYHCPQFCQADQFLINYYLNVLHVQKEISQQTSLAVDKLVSCKCFLCKKQCTFQNMYFLYTLQVT